MPKWQLKRRGNLRGFELTARGSASRRRPKRKARKAKSDSAGAHEALHHRHGAHLSLAARFAHGNGARGSHGPLRGGHDALRGALGKAFGSAIGSPAVVAWIRGAPKGGSNRQLIFPPYVYIYIYLFIR